MALIGTLSACILAATAGCAAATVALVRPDLTTTDPLCLVQATPARTVNGIGRVIAADAGKRHLTVDHEAIEGVMPAMEMMYVVKSRDLMERLKPKDQIRFTIDQSNMTITNIVVIPDTH